MSINKAIAKGMKDSNIKREWDTAIGRSVRALLSLEDNSGAFNWFHETIEAYAWTSLSNVTAGEVAQAMLVYKLQHLRSL